MLPRPADFARFVIDANWRKHIFFLIILNKKAECNFSESSYV